jgi:hypothetical protein
MIRALRNRRGEKMANPYAILIGAGISTLSIIGGQFAMPYRMAAGADGTWRVNTLTGDVQICSIAFGGCRSPKF